MLELSRVRRRKTKSKDWLGFRIGSVLGKHIAHRCLLDKIEQDGRIDVLAILFLRQMKMGTGTATAVACQGNDGAGTDMIAFGDEGLGEE